MSNINTGEVGTVIRINVGYDISAATPSMVFLPQYGETQVRLTGVTVGNTQVVTDLETFEANEYVEYTSQVADFKYVGKWKKRAVLTFDNTNIQMTDYEDFRVLP